MDSLLLFIGVRGQDGEGTDNGWIYIPENGGALAIVNPSERIKKPGWPKGASAGLMSAALMRELVNKQAISRFRPFSLAAPGHT